MSTTESATDHIGLPNAADARQDALIRLRETLAQAVQQAKDEAFDDLKLCLDAVKQQAVHIQTFDRAVVDLLPQRDRDGASRFLRDRDAASLWRGVAPEDLPF